MPEGCPPICNPSFTGTTVVVESVIWDGNNLVETTRIYTFKRGSLISVGDPVEIIIVDIGADRANIVYLDQNGVAMSAAGKSAYTTFQSAYDAANAMQVALGGSNKVLIMVGMGTFVEFGNLVLTADYNSNVILNGLGVSSSWVGTISGAFNFDCTAYNLQVESISMPGKAIHIRGADSTWHSLVTRPTLGSGGDIIVDDGLTVGFLDPRGVVVNPGDRAGDVTVGSFCILTAGMNGGCTTSNGNPAGRASIVDIGSYTRVQAGISLIGTVGGGVTLGDGCTVTSINTQSNTLGNTGGYVVLKNFVRVSDFVRTQTTGGVSVGSTGGAVTAGKHCKFADDIITGSGSAGTTGGAVFLDTGTIVLGAIDVRGAVIGGALTLKGENNIVGVTWTANPGVLLAFDSRITGKIDILNGASACKNVTFTTASGNLDCIGNVSSNGAQFLDCLFVPNGTGLPITASVARTVLAYMSLMKTAVGANIIITGANNFVDPLLIAE